MCWVVVCPASKYPSGATSIGDEFPIKVFKLLNSSFQLLLIVYCNLNEAIVDLTKTDRYGKMDRWTVRLMVKPIFVVR